MYVCMYVCMYVFMYVCMYVLYVYVCGAWWPSGAGLCPLDPLIMSSSPTTRRWILSNLLPLPPTTPTSPPSCEPGVSGQNFQGDISHSVTCSAVYIYCSVPNRYIMYCHCAASCVWCSSAGNSGKTSSLSAFLEHHMVFCTSLVLHS